MKFSPKCRFVWCRNKAKDSFKRTEGYRKEQEGQCAPLYRAGQRAIGKSKKGSAPLCIGLA